MSFEHRFGNADPPDGYHPLCDDCGEDCPTGSCDKRIQFDVDNAPPVQEQPEEEE